MAKDPAFLFYPGDWLGGTMTFTRSHKGAYMDLLMCQFNQGHMTLHDVRIVLGEKDFEEMWESKLRPKFKIDSDGKFYNEKLEDETVKRKKFTESRKSNLKKNTHTEAHMLAHMANHTPSRMENENENINTVLDDKKKEGVGGKGEEGLNGSLTYDVERELLDNRIQFERICMNTRHSEQTAKTGLRKYHLWLQENEKYPKTKRAAFAGFEKWLHNEPKNQKNGQNPASAIGKTIEFD